MREREREKRFTSFAQPTSLMDVPGYVNPDKLMSVPRERERERLQCFSQPASLITYRRRQTSNVENIKTVQNELENLHMILLCKKGSHGVCVRGKAHDHHMAMCHSSVVACMQCDLSWKLLLLLLLFAWPHSAPFSLYCAWSCFNALLYLHNDRQHICKDQQ